MFDEPEQAPSEQARTPADRAREKSDEFRMHAELCAVFEGPRKFNARVRAGLDATIARDCQKAIARLEKSKSPESPVLPSDSVAEATRLLTFPDSAALATGDYHVHRRPGEVMILRWLAGAEVDTFYDRLQAHFDAALEQHREDEKQNAWKGGEETAAYLAELEKIEIKMAERYARSAIRAHSLFVLSTQTADEIDILHLCDFIMNVPAAEVVGAASAPPDEDPTERDRAWFFKLFSLRGLVEGTERMFFFAFLQKSEEEF